MLKISNSEIAKAYGIAVNDLRSCYTDKGIYAGLRHFDDYWPHDSFFASYGANRLKDFSMVKKNFEFILKYQAHDGQIPLRIGTYNVLMKFGGKKYPGELKPRYICDKNTTRPMVDNLSIISAVLDYVRQSKDIAFAKKNLHKLESALLWLERKDVDHDFLLEENYYSTFMDSVKKKGKVLFSNVLYYQALLDFAELCRICNKPKLQLEYFEIAKIVKQKINDVFWNGKYYTDWVYKGKSYKYFATDPNCSAVLYGIADKVQANSIFEYIKKHSLCTPFPCATNHQRYSFWHVSHRMKLFFMSHYHNQTFWIWIGCIYALAQLKAGRKDDAVKSLELMSKKINEYGAVYELYDKSGKPLNTLFYKSEKPLAWSAGIFVWAVHEILKSKN